MVLAFLRASDKTPPICKTNVPAFGGGSSRHVNELRSGLAWDRTRRSRVDQSNRTPLEQQTNDFDIGRVHQERLSRVPLLSRADHRPPVRCLAAAFRAVFAQGGFDSSDHRFHCPAAFLQMGRCPANGRTPRGCFVNRSAERRMLSARFPAVWAAASVGPGPPAREQRQRRVRTKRGSTGGIRRRTTACGSCPK